MFIPRLDPKGVARSGSLFLICAGVTELFAWLFQWRFALRLVPDGPCITCDSAACFVVGGVGLWTAARGVSSLTRNLGFLLVLLGSSYFVAGIQGAWFSLHSFFPEFTAAVVAPLPVRQCRMALSTATVFCLLGTLLVLLAKPQIHRYWLNAGVLLASGMAAIGLVATVFHFAGLVDEGAWTRYWVSMSLPSGLCSAAAGVCAFLLFSLKLQNDCRFSSIAAALALPGFGLLFIGVNSAVFSNSQMEDDASAQLETVSRQAAIVQGVVESLQKAQSGERKFLLTNQDDALQSYASALNDISLGWRALRAYPSSGHLAAHLRSLIDQRVDLLSLAVRFQRDNKSNEALAIVKSGRGSALMDEIESESARVTATLNSQLEIYRKQNRRLAILLQRAVLASSAIAVLLIALGVAFLLAEIRRRANLEKKLLENSWNLQAKVEERTAEIRKNAEDLRDESAQRKLTASMLRDASERMRVALRLAKVAVWTWDALEDRTEWSGAVDEVFGFSADQLRQYSSVRDLIFQDDRESMDALIAKSVQEKQSFNSEFRIVLPDGGLRWIAGFGDVVCDQHGQVVRVAGVNLDITARKQVEEKLAESENRFREMAESLPQVVWTANADGEFEYQSDRWCELTGLPKGPISLLDRQRIVHPNDYQSMTHARREALRTGQPYDVECRVFHAHKQEYRWQWAHAVPIRDESGKTIRWFGTFADIHERKLMQLQLTENEQKLRKRDQQLALLFETGGVGDFTWDFSKNLVTAHPAIWALFGEPNASGSGPVSWFTSRCHPDDWAEMASALQAAVEGIKPLDVEYRVVWPDGTVRWLVSRGVTIHDHAGKPIQVHGLGFDITDRKMAALRVEESERHFREMANAMPQIVWRSAPNGEMDYCNGRWYEYSGLSYAQTREVGWAGVLHPEDYPIYVENGARGFASGQAFELEFRLKRASDAAYRWHLARSVPYFDRDGKIVYWFGAATDVHERKLAAQHLATEVSTRTAAMRELEAKEGQLVRSLAEKNTLLQEVHHRVKNNLQMISSLLRLQCDLVQDQNAISALRESQSRVLSMSLIHEQLYGNQHMDQIDFAAYARTLTGELFRSYASVADRLTCRFDTQQVSLQIDQAIPCGLILNELVTNALKYAYPHDRSGEVLIALKENEGGQVTLCVSDQGVGLPAGFDLNSVQSLGMPIVELLAQQLQGNLRVQPAPGAAFTIQFPKAAPKLNAASAA